MRLWTRAPGKINLCLYLGGRSRDGRHMLVTLFQPVSLADEVTLTVADSAPPSASASAPPSASASASASDVVVCPGVEGPNLAARALSELRARGWDGPPVRVEIVKRIPVAAGMAGGSADAGATLRLAAEAHPVPRRGLEREVAAELGADVPGQLRPRALIGLSTGQQLLYPTFDRGPVEGAFLILPSRQQLATAAVYAEADRLELPHSDQDLTKYRSQVMNGFAPERDFPVELMVNDLEPAAISLCPSIATALSFARELGADHALVCGSGPTVAGLFMGSDGLARATAAAAAAEDRGVPAVAATPVDAKFAAVHDD